MSLQANKLKKSVLKTGKKMGLVVEKDGPADRAISGSTKMAATLVNDGEKQIQKLASATQSKFDELRAKVHAATAPRGGKK